ncbi:MAG: rRNA pseudouridine synthase [Lachnospiraceae bacterium]|nr:rRNA pseudouridine synthase [Lachnospiraceae bacterium]
MAMRLDKYLADMGLGTRSEIKKAVRSGRVSVDGRTVRDPGTKVGPEDAVLFDGTAVTYEPYVYYMLHKPAGVISASEDRRERTCVDLIDETRRRDLFPVGRLDRDTEGLLLITNDGDLCHRLLTPSRHVDKVYFARVSGRVTGEDVRGFADGLQVDADFRAMPAQLRILRSDSVSEVEIVIREGKFHQIKRMFRAVGKEVLYLKRLSMGSLTLDPALQPGTWRRLTAEELAELRNGL